MGARQMQMSRLIATTGPNKTPLMSMSMSMPGFSSIAPTIDDDDSPRPAAVLAILRWPRAIDRRRAKTPQRLSRDTGHSRHTAAARV